MSATIINLPHHPAVKPKIDPRIPDIVQDNTLSANLTEWANNLAVMSCLEQRKASDPKNMTAILWRLSEGLEKMSCAAWKLERKYRKAKKRARR
jgi:hypothetical protein